MLKKFICCLLLLNLEAVAMDSDMKSFIAIQVKNEVAKQLQKTAPSALGFAAKCALSFGFNSAQAMFAVLGAAGAAQAATLGLMWLTKRDVGEVRKTQAIHGRDLTIIKDDVKELHNELPQLKEANKIIKEEIPGIKQQFAQLQSEVHQGFEKNNKDLLDLQQKMDVLPEKMEEQHQTTRTDLKKYIKGNLTQLRSSLSGAINTCFAVFEKNVEGKLEEQSKKTNQNINRMTEELKKDVNDLKKANEAHHEEILKNNQNLLDEVQIHRRETKGEMFITRDLLQQGIFHMIGLQVLLGGLNKKVGDLNTKMSDFEKSFPIIVPTSIRYTSGMGTGLAGYATTGNKLHNQDRVVGVESNNTKLIGFSSSMD